MGEKRLSKAVTDQAVFRATLSLGGSGPSVAVKDCLDIAGYVTGCGSAAFADAAPAAEHADVVKAILVSGCRITGKTGMHELAFGMTGVNPHYGTPVNVQWPDRIPGGSSSGSAVAAAAGLCDFAIGTDTGGSIRLPAVCCGVYGLKPSFGRISRRGAIPAESSLDCIGPLARSAGWLAKAMAAMNPAFVAETFDEPPRLVNILTDCAPEIGKAVEDVLALTRLAPPLTELPSLSEAFSAGMTIIGREAFAAFGGLLADGASLGDDVKRRLEATSAITDAEIAEAERVRVRFTSEVDAVLTDADALVLPALPVVPPSLEQASDPRRVLQLSRLIRPFNLSGHPALVMPVRTAGGLPAGIQLVGRKGEDARLCAVAEWLAENVPVFQREVL